MLGQISFEPLCCKKSLVFIFSCLSLGLVNLAPLFAQQAEGEQRIQVIKIEVKGAQHLTPEQIISASGLQVGQAIDLSALDAASQRIVDSGLVKNLRYRVRGKREGVTVTFEIEEAQGALPVVFDNFVWFKRDELLNAVRQDLPAFDGTIPEGGNAAANVAKSLEKLLRERGINGRVEYTLSTALTGKPQYLFSVRGAHLPICEIKYIGARDISADELKSVSRSLIGEDYSQELAQGFMENSVIPFYHQRGHLRARTAQPVAQPAPNTERCQNGVTLTVPVDEGSVYVWNGVEWTGNAAFSAEQLTSAVGMRANEIANETKIQRGFERALQIYGRQGYVAASFQTTPVFDDTARRVSYRVKVSEGAQYRMGSLSVQGLGDEDAEKVKAKWELSPGSVYDVSYIKNFVEKTLPLIRFENMKRINVEAKEQRDAQHLIVDVTLKFK
jgi:outer membrane protein assembly factor BamA